ncbi:MAG: hypothetical protein LBV18_06745 [Alistipes sp.]|nr:hypothetical protein [Alistipes sp.]
MKRILLYIAAAAMASLAVTSCGLGGEDFNEEFLYSGGGEWVSTQDVGDGPQRIHDIFRADGSGTSAAEGDIPQAFTWTLEGDRLSFEHIIGMGGTVPKDYTVTTLTETSLVYRDNYGKTISCTKL